MDRERVIQIARAAMGHNRTHPARERGYVFHHALRTARIALALVERIDEAPTLEASEDEVFAAALFHDVAKGEEPHNEAAARCVGELLTDERTAAVARIVREHNRCEGACRKVES